MSFRRAARSSKPTSFGREQRRADGMRRHCDLARFAMLLLLFSRLLCAHAQRQSSPYPATEEHPPPAWFVDVASKAGIAVRNVNGGVESKRYIIESTGTGVAILDYDRDGWPDIFLVNGTTLPKRQVRQNAQTHQPSLPQQSRRHLHRRDREGRPGRRRLGPGRLCRRLRQRRLRRSIRNRLWQESPLPQPGQRHLSRSGRRSRRCRHRQGVGHRLLPSSTTIATASWTSWSPTMFISIWPARPHRAMAPVACGRECRSCAGRADSTARPTSSTTTWGTVNLRT